MKLNNRGWSLKEEIILSGILLFCLLVATFYIISFYSGVSEVSKPVYKELEEKIEKAAIKYVNMYGENNVITSEVLEDNNLLTSFIDSKREYCKGYVLIKNDTYDPYIKCNEYKTKNFDDKYIN